MHDAGLRHIPHRLRFCCGFEARQIVVPPESLWRVLEPPQGCSGSFGTMVQIDVPVTHRCLGFVGLRRAERPEFAFQRRLLGDCQLCLALDVANSTSPLVRR